MSYRTIIINFFENYIRFLFEIRRTVFQALFLCLFHFNKVHENLETMPPVDNEVSCFKNHITTNMSCRDQDSNLV